MHSQQQHHRQQSKLFEGLRPGDLTDSLSHRITIDQYKSKMGNDRDIIVVAFKANDKFPAVDLMEFIEKGYPMVLDADMSTGEEQDGKYAVFVELERTPKVAKELDNMLRGIGHLCNCSSWHFKYFKDINGYPFTTEKFEEIVPLTSSDYDRRLKGQKISEVEDVLDQGSTEIVDIDESNNLTISKAYTDNVEFKLEAVGTYDDLSQQLEGGFQLDESSNSQTMYLSKYLGNYEINKIDNKFLVRNGDKAIIISKERW